MTDREKLVKCLKAVDQDTSNIVCEEGEEWGIIADHLIAKGVTIQKRGEWKPKADGFWKKQILICSICETRNALNYEFNYCPNCGAKMGGRT